MGSSRIASPVPWKYIVDIGIGIGMDQEREENVGWNEGRIWQEQTKCLISMAATLFENGSKP